MIKPNVMNLLLCRLRKTNLLNFTGFCVYLRLKVNRNLGGYFFPSRWTHMYINVYYVGNGQFMNKMGRELYNGEKRTEWFMRTMSLVIGHSTTPWRMKLRNTPAQLPSIALEYWQQSALSNTCVACSFLIFIEINALGEQFPFGTRH